jgi:hypothetical protein
MFCEKFAFIKIMILIIVAPPDPQEPWCVQFLIYIMSSSGSVVLEKIFKWPHSIFAFLWLSPLWRGPGPLFVQIRIPFTQGWFIPSLIEIGQLVLEKKIFKKFQCVFTLKLWLSPLGEEQSPSLILNKLELIPSSQGWFMPSLVKTGPVVLEKKSKM